MQTPKKSSDQGDQGEGVATPSTWESTSSNSSPSNSKALTLKNPTRPPPKQGMWKRKSNSIGSSWTVEMVNLQQCGSHFEVGLAIIELFNLDYLTMTIYLNL